MPEEKKKTEMTGGMREPDATKVMPEPDVLKAKPAKLPEPEKIGIHGFMVSQGLSQTKQSAFRSFVEQTKNVGDRSMRDWDILFKRFAPKSTTALEYLASQGIDRPGDAHKFEAWCAARGFPIWREIESWADDFRRYRRETAITG